MTTGKKQEIVIREGSIAEVLSLRLAIPEFEQPFGDEVYAERLKGKNYLILVAESSGKLVGFKVGYALDDQTFFSWMSGVLPAFRRNGIANILADVQDNWARKSGFSKLLFKTRNKYVSMIQFGLKRGFLIVDLVKAPKLEESRVIMEKPL